MEHSIIVSDQFKQWSSQYCSHPNLADSLTTCDELLCIILCHDSLHDFVADRGENSVVVIVAVVLDDVGEFVLIGLVENSQSNLDSLKICR